MFLQGPAKKTQANPDEDSRKNLRMQRGRIWYDNQPMKQAIHKPTVGSTLKLTNSQIEEAMASKIIEGTHFEEENSEFMSFSQKVRSIEDINRGFQKMKIKYADATHISCAYHLQNPYMLQDQGYEDDGEFGQGRSILNVMKEKAVTEICVYVVRYYGGKHLSNRRYKIAKDLTQGNDSEIQNLPPD